MSSKESAISHFRHELDDLGIHYHEELIEAIVKHLGPSIHDEDASLVACSDKEEIARVKNNFLIGKLGLENHEDMDKAIHEVCHHLGESNRKKHRATFYYLLVAILKQESKFIS